MEALAATGGTTPSRLVGRYLVHRRIAAGGMATVHLGRLLGAAGFTRTVAIKRLHDGYARDPDFVAMLLDEARLASQIRHPNVVPTLDVVAEQDELLVVMEYVDGDSLAHLAKLVHMKGERFPIPLAASIVAQSLFGLHAAHEAKDKNGVSLGIVHRDVSPQNVLVGVDGVARVLDFGIAKAASRATATEDGQIKGKAAYMSPEQLQFGAVDRRTDIWAASVMFWELLTGKRLFLGDSPAQTMARVMNEPIDPPSRWAPELPMELSMICLRGLERDQEGRFETAEEMALAIEDAIAMPRAKEIGAWVRATALSMLEARAEQVREVEREEAPEIPSAVTTNPELRAAMDEAERRRNMVDTPTDMGVARGPTTPRGQQFARDPGMTPRTGPFMPAVTNHAGGPEVTDLATVRGSNNFVIAPESRVSRFSVIVGVLGGVVLAAAAVIIFILLRRPAPVDTHVIDLPPPPPISEPLDAGVTHAAPSVDIDAGYVPPVFVPGTASSPPKKPKWQGTKGPVLNPRAPDCRIPYDLDSKGVKHFRPECV